MNWHISQRRTHGRRHAALAALLFGFALALLTGGGVAQAGTDAFCSQNVASGTVCPGPSHSLTGSRGTNNGSGAGCGGAYSYGSYYCADPAGCHEYEGLYVLTPGIRHRSSTTKNMSGYSTWGSTGAPSSCVHDSVYSAVAVAGPVSRAAAELDGVPVLQRDQVTAPRRAAALVPQADPAAARRFTTPHGDAYVLVDPASREVCLVADDQGTGYGVSCQSYNRARLSGSLSTFEDDDVMTAKGDVVIALMADGVDGLDVTRTDGTTRRVAATGGVVAVTLGATDRGVELDTNTDAGVPAQKLSMRR